MHTDGFAVMFWFIIIFLIVGVVIAGIIGIVDLIGGYELESTTIECVITHMDIDGGENLVSISSIDGGFSKTISVSSEEYAKYSVGDTCTVIRSGNHFPTRGDVFNYKIAEVK